MTTDRILPVNKEHLLLMQVLCWLGPGIKILIAGIQAVVQVHAFFMMGLGISLKYIPCMPVEFFVGFYPGLGTALSIAGVRYFISWCKAR